MNCEQVRELIDLAAVGAAEPAELRALDAHLAAGCAACAGRYAEAQAVVAEYARTAPDEPVPVGALDRLLASLPAKRSVALAPSRPNVPTSNRLRTWAYAAAAVVAFVGVGITGASLLQAYVLRQELVAADERYQKAQDDASRFAPVVTAFRTHDAALIDLQPGTGQGEGAWGRIFWDKHRSRWNFYASGLHRAAEGKVYQLWAVADDESSVSLGTIEVDAHGFASFDAELPLAPEKVAQAIVTEEPLGGSLRPSGAIQLIASID